LSQFVYGGSVAKGGNKGGKTPLQDYCELKSNLGLVVCTILFFCDTTCEIHNNLKVCIHPGHFHSCISWKIPEKKKALYTLIEQSLFNRVVEIL